MSKKKKPILARWYRKQLKEKKRKELAEKRASGPYAGLKNPLRFTSFCPCAYSYSYSVNGDCLDCSFCYKKSNNLNHKRLQAKNLEKFITDDILQVPIIISTSCDPMYSEYVKNESYKVAKYILENNGKIIYKSAIAPIDARIHELASEYKDHFLYQPRFMSSNDLMGETIRKNLSQEFSSSDVLIDEIIKFKDHGCQIVPIFDPVILHINDTMVQKIINHIKSIGIYKIILKQLFATNSFRSELLLYNPDAYKDLCIKVGNYYTYDSVHLIEHLSSIFYDENISISFCSNNHLNKILNKNNCCQFENHEIFYKNDIKFMNLKQRKEKICLK